MTMKLLLPISIISRQQLSDVLLTITLWQSACLLMDFEIHPPLQLEYIRRAPKFWLSSSDWLKKTQCSIPPNSQTDLTPFTVSMMSGDDRGFVCGWTGHFGCHCPNAQCYCCDEFGHIVKACPNKIPPSETPYHQDRSHSRHQYTHNQKGQITLLLWSKT